MMIFASAASSSMIIPTVLGLEVQALPAVCRLCYRSWAMEETDYEPSALDIGHHVAAWALFYVAGGLCSFSTWWAWAGVPLLLMTSSSLLADFVFIPPMRTTGTGMDPPNESKCT
jgi:hypothetical protein